MKKIGTKLKRKTVCQIKNKIGKENNSENIVYRHESPVAYWSSSQIQFFNNEINHKLRINISYIYHIRKVFHLYVFFYDDSDRKFKGNTCYAYHNQKFLYLILIR